MSLENQNTSSREKLLERGFLKAVDFAFANIFRKKVSEESFSFLCYLFALGRLGHHSILVEDRKITPDALDLLQDAEKDLFLLELLNGAQNLPESLCQNFHGSVDLRPIVKDGDRYYLQKYFLQEHQIASSFASLLESSMKSFTSLEVEEAMKPYVSSLNPEQLLAVKGALHNRLFILSGGPGTGKTYTIEHLLKIYYELSKEKQPRILASAPTGKATSHLKQKLGEIPNIEIKTLHSALKLRGNQAGILSYDLIVVDECSMIDLHVWKTFFANILENTKVVLVGDYHQLPPVETGMIFEELFHAAVDAHVELKECLRIENRGIHTLAQSVNENDFEKAAEVLQSNTKDLRFFEFAEEKSILNIENLDLESEFKHFEDPKKSIQNLLENLKKMCMLSPINKGIWGVKTINREIYEFLKTRAKNSTMVIPIMITQTDYSKNLYNGDLGILINNLVDSRKDTTYFYIEGEIKEYKKQLLPNFEYAYCVTVHKSQGSEFEKAMIFLPGKSEIFGKELLYTALTRAKYSCTLFAKEGVLKKCFFGSIQKNTFNPLMRYKKLNLEEKA